MSIPVTERFSDRVESYRHHRPAYPQGVVTLLAKECSLSEISVIADVAAGTGLLSEVFLKQGFQVTAVEPNAKMRQACADLMPGFPRLSCASGTAEATGLQAESADLVTVAQAMHWFDQPKARAEFVRVLKPQGWCAIVYNHRRRGGDAFHDGYEAILAGFGSDYYQVQERHLSPEQIVSFFSPQSAETAHFGNEQRLDLEALEGRILSSSYMPQPGSEKYASMRQAIEKLFAQNKHDGTVRLEYDCAVTYGRLR
ncbi:class I SAM-dependent methyltransferase [Silvibacterium acidisoli]|uniref:class I SAM-dependent methyltransferase n=1 Tax=Acidobacteriaceae bacterium ZG23-2 TaxID=2883246 RepID=UPI00406D0D6A